MKHWTEALDKIGACEDAARWARQEPDYATAWATCTRADWMLWLAAKLAPRDSDSHRQVVLAACACARTALRFVKPGELRPLKAIETAEGWARKDGTTIEQVRAAAADADASYAASYAADASDGSRKKSLSEQADIVRTFFPVAPPLPGAE